MGSAESILTEIEQVGKDIETGVTRAVDEIDSLGKEFQSATDRLMGSSDDPDSLTSFLEDLTGQSLVKKLVNDEPEQVPMAVPEPRRSDMVVPTGSVEPVPTSNPDPQIPDNPIPDNPIPDNPIPDIPGGGRHLVPTNPTESSGESHLENVLENSGSYPQFRVENPEPTIKRKYLRGGNRINPIWTDSTIFYDVLGFAGSTAIFALSYVLMATYQGLRIHQSYSILGGYPMNTVHQGVNKQWYFTAGQFKKGKALKRMSQYLDHVVSTTNIGYYLRLPTIAQKIHDFVSWIFHIPEPSITEIVPIIQKIINGLDQSVRVILSTLGAGIGYNIYDAIVATNTFEQQSYPGKNTIVPQPLHIGATIVNSVIDTGALKLLAVIPTIFGVTDPDLSLKLVNCLWSFGKDLRPGNGKGSINQAIDNLFNVYIPSALDGRRILDLIPQELKDSATAMFGSNVNFLTSEDMIIDVLKKLVNSGQFVKIFDEIFSSIGATSESIDGLDMFWNIFKNKNISSVLKDAVIGFKTSEPQAPISLISPTSGQLNILGFQLYHSDIQTDINSDVGKGADENDAKLINFEVHGKYCGAGNPIDNGEPIDAFDRACQKHDIGYMKKGMFNAETDAEFVKDLETILKDETLDKMTRLKVKGAKLHFERASVIQHGKKTNPVS